MSDQTEIEWTDATWNPITGCSLVSEGCRNCYAAELDASRLKNLPSRIGLAKRNAKGVAQFNGTVRLNENWLEQPLGWSKPRKIFVCAHGDLFHESVPDEWIDKVFAVMAIAPHHTFQVLTKRPERMRDYLLGKTVEIAGLPKDEDLRIAKIDEVVSKRSSSLRFGEVDKADYKLFDWFGDPEDATHPLLNVWPLPNVWLGVSVEDQATVETRLRYLCDAPASVRFVSAEPLLRRIDLTEWLPSLDWVICGGESGRNARPMHPDWARTLRDQCAQHGVAFSFKQWGVWLPWEQDSISVWRSQNGLIEDSHSLFANDLDADPAWDDGLSFLASGEEHSAFQKVSKKLAGRLLDGQLHDAFPRIEKVV